MESAPAFARRGFWFWLPWLGALAFGIRLLNVWYVVRAVDAAQILDAAYYHDVALAMLGRQHTPNLVGEVAFANIGYPYVLKWIYSVSPSPTSVLVTQALVGAATAMLTGMFARELFGQARVGLWAAGLFALYAPSIFYDGLLLIPSLSAFLGALLACSLCRAIRLRSWRWSVVAGLAIGMAAILRATQLLLLAFAMFAIVRLCRRRPRHRRRLLLALLLATTACVAPIVIWQRIDSAVWIPLTTNGGMNFWIGNHRGASGGYKDMPFLGSSKGGDFRHTIVIERDQFLTEARRRSGNAALSLAGSDGFWWRETGRAIATAPGEWLRLQVRKSQLVVSNYESRTNASLDFMEEVSPVLRWNPLRFGVMAILATLGALELRRSKRRWATWSLATVMVVPLLTCIFFFVSGEYRHPAAPAVVALAALFLGRFKAVVGAWTSHRWFVAWSRCLLLLFTVVLAFTSTERLGPAKDRKAYAEALAMPSSDGTPPTLERYALARKLLLQHGNSPQDRILSTEALLLVESNQSIQFRDRDAADRLIQVAKTLWQEEIQNTSQLDGTTIDRIRRNTVRRLAQLCRQPFVKHWQPIQRQLVLLGCNSWSEIGYFLGHQMLTQAQATLDRASELAPNSVEVLAYRGQLELMRGHDPTPWLKRSLDGYPKLALPASLMAQYEWAKGDASSARRYAQEALKRDPSNRATQEIFGNSEQASQQTEPQESSQLLANHWRALLREGRYALAIAVLQSAVRDGPYDEVMHYTLGNLMLMYAAPDAMLEFFSSELGRDEKPQSSYYFLAKGFESMGNDEAAFAELRQALALDPAHEMSHRQWGLMLERRGELLPALEHLVEATRIHPEYRAALDDAARVAARLGRYSEAKQWLERALLANPDTPRRFLYWAKYLHEHGRDSAALQEVARRLAQDPRDAEALELSRVIHTALAK